MGEPILLVTGTPGTGKTLVGRIITSNLGCRFIQTSPLLYRVGAVKPDPTGRHTSVVDWRLGLETIRRVAREEPSCIVAETLYPSLWMEAAEDSIAAIILLRCHPRELCKRLESRGWHPAKVAENCAAEALGSVAVEVDEWRHMVAEVDTTGKSPGEVAEEALSLLSEWRMGIRIDWLSVDEGLVEELTRWLSRVDSDKYGLVE